MLKPAQSHTNSETHPNVKQPFEMRLWLFTFSFLKTGQILPEMPQPGTTQHRPITGPSPVSHDHNPEKCPGNLAGKERIDELR